MLKLQTPVKIETGKVRISYDDKIMILGSCFADNIGRLMQNAGFDVLANPFGTLYNPKSILNSVKRLHSGHPFTESDCVTIGSGSDLICSFSHGTKHGRKTAGEFLKDANEDLIKACDFYDRCNRVIITLGTAWCYNLKTTGETVTNCLKRDASEFNKVMMSIEEVEKAAGETVRESPDKQYILTVSPIRHLSDGAHNNQLSKSTLLIASDKIAENENCDYFPSYEIVMDELRDYRFYAEDMAHPSDQTIGYLWERFIDFSMDDKCRQTISDKLRDFKRSSHIPINY